MNFEWFMASRYFKGKRKDSRFLSFIKIMAITAVAIGSAGLLIALSIVHGFKSVIDNKILGFAPHITVTSFTDDLLFRSDTLKTYLEKYPQIDQIQATVTGEAMIQSSEEASGVFFKGVEPRGDVTDIRQYITSGKYRLTVDSTGLPGLVIGSKLAGNLKVGVGSVLTAYTIEDFPTPLSSPEIQQFRISGIYQTGIDQFDDLLALVDRNYIRKLFKVPGIHASSIEISLKDKDDIQSLEELISAELLFPYYTESIYDRYGNIFAWVDLQEETIPFVISVMIIVAAFNLIGTVLMMVLERTRDIGILKTIGAKSKEIRSIYLLEGVFVAGVGLLLGIGISIIFYWLQTTYHIIPLSEQNYYMAYAPVEPHLFDFILVGIVTFVLCTLASWLPARIASNTDPLQVIAFGR